MNKAQRLRNAIMGYKTGEAPPPSEKWKEYGNLAESIEALTGQYILTDYMVKPNTKVKLKVNMPSSLSGYVFGFRLDKAQDFCLQSVWTTYGYSMFDCARTTTSMPSGSVALGKDLEYEMSASGMIINGQVVSNTSFYGDYSTITPENVTNLALFDAKRTETTMWKGGMKGKMYYFDIYESDILIHQYRPILLTKAYNSQPVGSYIMWDILTDTPLEHFGTFTGS